MKEARLKIAMSNIICEIDRRCFDITHPMPDDTSVILDKLGAMARIIEHTSTAVLNMSTGEGKLEDVENVLDYISKERIREYEEEKSKHARG